MYAVASIDPGICSRTKCRQCTMFCPEPNCITYINEKYLAVVNQSRCKGCGLCVFICDTTIKAHAITMVTPDFN